MAEEQVDLQQMTVAQLIAELQKMPPDEPVSLEVSYQGHDDTYKVVGTTYMQVYQENPPAGWRRRPGVFISGDEL